MYGFDDFGVRERRVGRGWMYASIALLCLVVVCAAAFIMLWGQGGGTVPVSVASEVPTSPVAAAATSRPTPAATRAPSTAPPSAPAAGQPAAGEQAPPIIAGFVDGNPIPAIYKRVGPSVVGIVNKVRYFSNLERGMTEDTGATGSGIIITDDGYIVTNSHVIEGGSSFSVILADGEEVSAELVGSDAHTDLALLKIDRKGLTAAPLGDSAAVEIGEIVIAIGNPLGQEFGGTVTMGIISGKNRVINMDNVRYTLLQTDAAVNPGSSGGALINLNGEVIGINTLKYGGIDALEGLGFAIPIDEARPIIEALMEYGRIKRPAIGISGMTIDEYISEMYDLPQGVYVQEVLEGGPAEKAGMLAEDIIIEVDGVDVLMFADLLEALEAHAVGDTVEVRVYRDSVNDEVVMNITLYESPAE